MGNFRELIGRDLASTLEADYHEMPVDRVGAFSRASRIGTLLWRLKFAHDAAAYKPAVLLLAKHTSLQSQTGTRLCEMAVSEWLMPQCQSCLGATEMIVGLKRIICPDCKGLGVKRYSDPERNRFLSKPLSWQKPDAVVVPARFAAWKKKYATVFSQLTGGDRGVGPVMNAELEK